MSKNINDSWTAEINYEFDELKKKQGGDLSKIGKRLSQNTNSSDLQTASSQIIS